MYKFTINNRHLAYSHQQHRQHHYYQIIIKTILSKKIDIKEFNQN